MNANMMQGARLGLLDQTPPSGLTEPAAVAFNVVTVTLKDVAAAAKRAQGERIVVELEGGPRLEPGEVMMLKVISPEGPFLLEAHAMPGRFKTPRVRVTPLARRTQEWLERQT